MRSKKVAILGASRGMGRALARLMAARGDQLVLLGRHVDQLESSARDLEIRGASGTVGVCRCDLEDTESFEPALEQAAAHLDGLEIVIVTAAMFGYIIHLLLCIGFTLVLAFFVIAILPLDRNQDPPGS